MGRDMNGSSTNDKDISTTADIPLEEEEEGEGGGFSISLSSSYPDTTRDHPWKVAKSNAAKRYAMNMECLREVFCLPSSFPFYMDDGDNSGIWTAEQLLDQLRKWNSINLHLHLHLHLDNDIFLFCFLFLRTIAKRTRLDKEYYQQRVVSLMR